MKIVKDLLNAQKHAFGLLVEADHESANSFADKLLAEKSKPPSTSPEL